MSDMEFDEVDGNCLKKPTATTSEEYDEAIGPIMDNNNDPDTVLFHYNMKHKQRGIAMIFNHEIYSVKNEFNQSMNIPRRKGTEKDRKKLKEVLEKLKFKVLVYQDLKYRDIISHVKDIASVDHSNHDCICIIVLSHGDSEGKVFAKDTSYKLYSLWNYFDNEKCPSLAGKPKIFFVQACRGNQHDTGVKLSKTETDFPIIYNHITFIPPPDFVVMYATLEGYYSWRNPKNGSCFIQSLCDELRKNGKSTSLLTLLTSVSQNIAIDFESNVPCNPDEHKKKQISCILSTLTRVVQFS